MKSKYIRQITAPFLAFLCGFGFALDLPGADTPIKSASLPPEIQKSLVLYFDFNGEPLDGKVADRSGHGNDGLLVNVAFNKDGHQGGAAKFALNDSYITVPNNEDLNPRQVTLAAWIKTSYSDKVWRRIFDKCYSKGFALSEGGDQKQWHHQGMLEWETGVVANSLSPQRLDDGQWHHVAATYDGMDAKIYLDGWTVGKPGHKTGEIHHTDYDLTIGSNRSNPDGAFGEIGASFNGLMDDVMMFNRALSEDEIQTLFRAQGGALADQVAQPAPGADSQNKPTATDRLKQVKALFDQGLINKEEYDKKVKEIHSHPTGNGKKALA